MKAYGCICNKILEYLGCKHIRKTNIDCLWAFMVLEQVPESRRFKTEKAIFYLKYSTYFFQLVGTFLHLIDFSGTMQHIFCHLRILEHDT